MTNSTTSKVTMRSSLSVSSPFNSAELDKFFASLPADGADITVSTRMGGDQRDPYPVGYAFSATWEI